MSRRDRHEWGPRGPAVATAVTIIGLTLLPLAPRDSAPAADEPSRPRETAAPRDAGGPSLPARPARTGELPDTVLAVVGSDRTITRSNFLRAWREQHEQSPTDSLTLPTTRKFLELLIDRELLAQAASRESWAWSPAEAAGLDALADRLALAAALDSALAEARASLLAADPARGEPEAQDVGMAARDSAVSRLALRLDDALLERLTAAWVALPQLPPDSSLASHMRALSAMPSVAAEDTARLLAWSAAGEYRVSELLAAWRRLSPVYRPRIEVSAQLVDMVKNGLFERLLREQAARRHLAERPDIAAAVAHQRESMAVAHYLRREVSDRISPDVRTLQRYYGEHSADWALPTRVRAIRLSFDTRAEAERTALLLRSPAEAESLASRARRAGIEYRVEASARTDSTLFSAAESAGTGAVVRPVRDDRGWWVARVEALLPGRAREFAEVRDEVEARWTAEESERLLGELCRSLARRTRPVINEEALARLAGTSP